MLNWFRNNRDSTLASVVVLIVGILVLVPIVVLIYSSFRTGRPGYPGEFSLSNYTSAYLDINTYITIWRSVYFAIAATLLSLFMGSVAAWLLERTNMPGRATAYTLMLSPMAIPRMLYAIAWILLLSANIGIFSSLLQSVFGVSGFNIFSMTGMIWVQALIEVPTSFLMVLGTFRSMDPSLEEAAAVGGSTIMGTLRQITAPLARPGLLASGIFLFTVNMEVFEVPGIIGLPAGIRVFATTIYTNANVLSPPRYGLANTYAVTFLVLSIFLVIMYRRATRDSLRFATVTGKGYRGREIDLGRWRYVATSGFSIFFLVTVLAPILILLYSSFLPLYLVPSYESFGNMSFDNYIALMQAPWLGKVLRNTFIVMTIAPLVAVMIAGMTVWVIHRSALHMRWKRVLDILSFLPQATPSIVIALALILVFLNVSFLPPIYGTVWIIALAFIIRYLPYATRTIGASVLQIHKELDESAQICGASGVRSFYYITLPLVGSSLINVGIWVAMQSARALSAALMLFSTKNEVLSARIWSTWFGGDIPMVGAIAVVMTVVLLVISTVGRSIASRLRH